MKELLVEKSRFPAKNVAVIAFFILSILFTYHFFFSSQIPSEFLSSHKVSVNHEPLKIKGGGEIIVENTDVISSPYAGVIDKVEVIEGQTISKGIALTKIKNHKLELDLVESQDDKESFQADIELDTIELEQLKLTKQSELEKLLAMSQLKQKEADAQKELREKGIVSEIALHSSNLELELIKLDLKSKRKEFTLFSNSYAAKVNNFKQRLEVKKRRVSYLTGLLNSLQIQSSLNGFVKKVHVQKGQIISEGQPLFELIDPEQLVAKVNIPQYSVSSVKQGQVVEISTPNGLLSGTVDSVDNVVRNGAINIIVKFNNELPEWLKLGQSIEATIFTDKLITKQYITKPDNYEQYTQWLVYELTSSNSARLTDYQLSPINDDTLNLTGGGKLSQQLLLIPKQFAAESIMEF